jgi:hypothetical protein
MDLDKGYYWLRDAAGRSHWFYGTRAEFEAACEGFKATSNATGCRHVFEALREGGLEELAAAMEAPAKSGFVHGDALVAFVAFSEEPSFRIWQPEFDEPFRPQYRNWISRNVGSGTPVNREAILRFDSIVDAVLRPYRHPACFDDVAA